VPVAQPTSVHPRDASDPIPRYPSCQLRNREEGQDTARNLPSMQILRKPRACALYCCTMLRVTEPGPRRMQLAGMKRYRPQFTRKFDDQRCAVVSAILPETVNCE
jgi:hypothetical protein